MNNKGKSLFLVGALFLSYHLYGQNFSKISSSPIVNIQTKSYGHAWGDYDNDGDLDLFLVNDDQPNKLFINNGGNFTDSGNSLFTQSSGTSSFGATWSDYDNDGFLDLYVTNTNMYTFYRKNSLFSYDGSTFTELNISPLTEETNRSFTATWGNVGNDPYIDVFVGNDYEANKLYATSDGTTYSNVISSEMGFVQGSSWCDYDNDGFLELFVARDGSNLLYDNDGNSLSLNSSFSGGTNRTFGGSWGDYNNDGWMDLFITNIGTGSASRNVLYRNDNGTLTPVSSGEIVEDEANSYGSTWGDFDNDGWLDLFVANSGSDNVMYKNDGDGTFTKITAGELLTSGNFAYSCSSVDYDNDGLLDIYVTDYDQLQENLLFQNQTSNTNHWFHVKLVGNLSNKSGLGAKVKITANINGVDVTQTREISAQTGFAAQSGLNAYFGLGDAANIDIVRIEWPSGIIQEYTNVSPDQVKTIEETAAPNAPSNLQSSESSYDYITLTWDDNSSTATFNNETHFVLEISEGDNTNYTPFPDITADNTTYQADLLTPGTDYYFKIKAVNESGESAYSRGGSY